MAIERLKKDARCNECGALLKKGTRAKVYRKADGTVLVYGFDCHGKKRPTQNENEAPKKELDEALVEALADIRQALWTVVTLLKGNGEKTVPTEQVLDEVNGKEPEPEEQAPTAADWRRFWVTVKRLGWDNQSLHELYQCESMKEVIKTKSDMEKVLEELRALAL